MTRTVFIAGDDSNIRDFLQTILEREGYDVIQADGDQTLAVAQTLQNDTFILDVEKPRMGGINLCRSLRAMEQYRRTPILVLTGDGADDILDPLLRPAAMTLLRNRAARRPVASG
jgi:two-component system chemotaxis response regulator CheY